MVCMNVFPKRVKMCMKWVKLETLPDDCVGQMAGKQQPPKYRAYPGEQKGFATATTNEGFPSAFKNRADNGKNFLLKQGNELYLWTNQELLLECKRKFYLIKISSAKLCKTAAHTRLRTTVIVAKSLES